MEATKGVSERHGFPTSYQDYPRYCYLCFLW